MTEKYLGTVRWFGENWGAPVCEPEAHVPTPVDQTCPRCFRAIRADDQGVTVPFVATDTVVQLAYHLDCWLTEIGAQVTREVLGEEKA